jgi:hypothetical protein
MSQHYSDRSANDLSILHTSKATNRGQTSSMMLGTTNTAMEMSHRDQSAALQFPLAPAYRSVLRLIRT